MARREFDFGNPSREFDQRLDLLMSREKAQVGGVSMVAGGFGDYYESLEDVIATIPHDYPDREELAASLYGLGFGGGFKNSADLSPTMSQFYERMGLVGAGAVADIMEMKGWDGIDLLIVGSSSANIQVPKMITYELGKKSRTIDNFLMNAQACNSSASAINDACRDPQLSGKRVVVLSEESLSGSAVDPTDFMTRSVFGNLYGGVGFVPGKDIVHIMGQNTMIEQDREGVIRAPAAFRIENKGDIGEPTTLPPWYQIVGDIDSDFLHATSRGVFINLPSAQKLTMNGRKTFNFFSSRVPSIELAVLEEYYSQWFGKDFGGMNLGELGVTVAHMPSFLVHSSKCMQVERGRRKGARENAAYPNFKVPESPWLMDKIGVNNASAATMLVNMTYMAQHNMIIPGIPFLMEGYGAGAAFSTNVMMIR
ncbi:hypothetical protein CO051_05925 [Candidatus Roizmanbacteria bacterium CG_4_9_14_0_2_um_filter_39_13]|uniref:Beta-ketoacyl-[acyl-carrier-protein] synthase III C-terminal domain-containing protein n=2 Tax=Candidatus Roizmaniibacteriota TaxID=1752723 RepID=A0A2M8EX07_9BACT|nr:MAG: hypothetical protein COY15_04600 [Candidatus Roizmanbacteria bacterium CG_4_10_14_0_2_um_filter_39_12]PJC30402.1 MAG: hypothetical protein CO051_05925 [Candidatus Roizmanbacteria bacterium CG_4_9_14_0_2_um_filter_39_13]PJE61476.1 MAG: hypothetical protein COU87_04265 [Candidatus Roizmanbacteria bacterium CG10_big_fil_rev_8_21_14_0_10_39_12]